MPAGIDRLKGFHAAMTEAGVTPVAVENGDFTESGGASAMTRVLSAGERPDALFVASDLMARGAYEVLREKGIEPGRDIAVIGFDDSAVCRRGLAGADHRASAPSLTQGRHMASVLLDILAGRPAVHATILPTEIIERASRVTVTPTSAVSGSMPCARALASIASHTATWPGPDARGRSAR